MSDESRVLEPSRIVSLDQFRGYAVAGMFVVNFLGAYVAVPTILRHTNTFCSYADTIMPHFFFAVGFAYRLTFLRRLGKQAARTTYWQAIRRNLGLILIGLVVYGLDPEYDSWAGMKQAGLKGFLLTSFESLPWQALVHIGLTGLWVLPVIARGMGIRLVFVFVCAVAHIIVLHGGYYEWAFRAHTIDGGPLGFLTWSIPMLIGSIAYDLVATRSPRMAIKPILLWAVVLMLLGYGLSCITTIKQALQGTSAHRGVLAWLVEPPFIPPSRPVDMWTMCQRTGSTSYQFFGAGFSLFVYALFLFWCDLRSWSFGVFRTFGQNALAAYLIHGIVSETVQHIFPRDVPVLMLGSALLLFFGITYFFVHHLEKNNIFLRL